jgi:hypothetical protein
MRNTYLQEKKIIFIAIISSFIFLEGCSTVNVVATQASKSDDIFTTTVVALWWGGSDPVENVDCRGNGLQFVSAQTNWFYSLVTVVTLGAVVPIEVEYRCTSIPMQDGGTIGWMED